MAIRQMEKHQSIEISERVILFTELFLDCLFGLALCSPFSMPAILNSGYLFAHPDAGFLALIGRSRSPYDENLYQLFKKTDTKVFLKTAKI